MPNAKELLDAANARLKQQREAMPSEARQAVALEAIQDTLLLILEHLKRPATNPSRSSGIT